MSHRRLGDDFPWDRQLKFRWGSPERLEGIELYTDCSRWSELFRQNRAQFKNGKALAQLVKRDCPVGKTAALLLTTREDVREHSIITDTRFVAVVNLPRYLAQATPDAAISYYARQRGPLITSEADVRAVAARDDVIDAVVDGHLDAEHIQGWAADNAERLEQLRKIAGTSDTVRATADISDVAAALRLMESLDAEIVEAITGLLGPELDPEVRLQLLQRLTDDRAGRYVTAEVLGERIRDRLSDLRGIADEYSALVTDPTSGEMALQDFIEKNPWLLGLDYVMARPRRQLPRGTMDFILERYDGLHDLLELKNPQDAIIEAPDEVDGVPPAASQYRLSDALAQALAQIHVYRETLRDTEMLERQYGLSGTRDTRAFVVIGQTAPLPEHRADVLRELNLSLHRVEIVPYDVVGDRIRTVLDNIERYLSPPETAQPAD